MAYCRFRNTLTDLLACQEALDAGFLDDDGSNKEEVAAARRLLKVCASITEDHGEVEE